HRRCRAGIPRFMATLVMAAPARSAPWKQHEERGDDEAKGAAEIDRKQISVVRDHTPGRPLPTQRMPAIPEHERAEEHDDGKQHDRDGYMRPACLPLAPVCEGCGFGSERVHIGLPSPESDNLYDRH